MTKSLWQNVVNKNVRRDTRGSSFLLSFSHEVMMMMMMIIEEEEKEEKNPQFSNKNLS